MGVRISGTGAGCRLAGRCRFRSNLLVNVRMEHPDKWQIAIALGKIQPISDDEKIWNFKSHIIRFDLLDSPRGFIQQDASLNAPRFKCLELCKDAKKCFARIENVVDQQHIASANIQTQLFCKNQVARLRAGSVTGYADKIKSQRQRKISD